jgi:hypothetical protein
MEEDESRKEREKGGKKKFFGDERRRANFFLSLGQGWTLWRKHMEGGLVVSSAALAAFSMIKARSGCSE